MLRFKALEFDCVLEDVPIKVTGRFATYNEKRLIDSILRFSGTGSYEYDQKLTELSNIVKEAYEDWKEATSIYTHRFNLHIDIRRIEDKFRSRFLYFRSVLAYCGLVWPEFP